MKSSCLNHPASEPLIVIRKWQLEFCEGNACAAALLSFFSYWHDIKLEMSVKNTFANDTAEKHGDTRTQDESLYQFHTAKELELGIMLYSEDTIRRALEVLVRLQCLTIHKNPNPRYAFDKTKHFLFHPKVCNSFIFDTREVLSRYTNNPQRSPQSPERSPQNPIAIPETTSETTSEKRTTPPPPNVQSQSKPVSPSNAVSPGTNAPEAPVELTPDMVASAVMCELGISGNDLRMALWDIAKHASARGQPLNELTAQLICAWQEYDDAAPNLSFHSMPQKFFASGTWRNKARWGWKDGATPKKPRKYVNVDQENPE